MKRVYKCVKCNIETGSNLLCGDCALDEMEKAGFEDAVKRIEKQSIEKQSKDVIRRWDDYIKRCRDEKSL